MLIAPYAGYRRAQAPQGTYFCTRNTQRRRGCTLLTQHIDSLRTAVRTAQRAHPLRIHGWVVLPEHLHAANERPPGDADFATRRPSSKAAPVGAAPSLRISRPTHSARGRASHRCCSGDSPRDGPGSYGDRRRTQPLRPSRMAKRERDIRLAAALQQHPIRLRKTGSAGRRVRSPQASEAWLGAAPR